MNKQYYIYLLANKKNGTLYTGITNDLLRRIYEHKKNLLPGFTAKYNIHNLVHYEQSESIETAIQREKQIKNWKRSWKIELIEQHNPYWRDLYQDLIQ